MSKTKKEHSFGKEISASRVAILDAVDLDSEIYRILKEQLLKTANILSPYFVRWEPELEVLLRLIIWKESMYQLKSSFGQQLLSAKYTNQLTSRKAIIWALLSIGSPYLKHRISDFSTLFTGRSLPELASRVVEWLDLGVQVASLLNLLLFLREGHYATLPDRITGLKTVPSQPAASRAVGYSFMTRELLWHGFIELIVFILPLINYKYVQRCLAQLVGLRKRHDISARFQQGLTFSVSTRCAVCLEPPVLPHQMGCSHAFCYYCLKSNMMADTKFECPSCGHSIVDIDAIQPVSSKYFLHS